MSTESEDIKPKKKIITITLASHKAISEQKNKLKRIHGRGVSFSETIEHLCKIVTERG